ncbi:hypothetical protein B0H17DRAFT_1197802 [Mycena rosella]|uniref:Uncharacterized protein n=1 Tax=Mycena rosella TaxID=1033263 RepID=A0AAD7DQA2_MYCRO|nr:hypothetical protein B0H17DRAFT_1197802 [Mycena rosella]
MSFNNTNDTEFGRDTDERAHFAHLKFQFVSDCSNLNNGNSMGQGGKVPMDDKLEGSVEKLAGKVMGNTSWQEHSQEHKAFSTFPSIGLPDSSAIRRTLLITLYL